MGFASVAAILLAGFLIGATGIGGVLVVPALTSFGGVLVTQAIAATALGFGFPAIAALWFLLRGGDRAAAKASLPLVWGSLAGALAGAMLVRVLDAKWLLGGIAVLVLLAGLRGLLTPHTEPRAPLGATAMAVLGVLVGIGSALTGTGGPVLVIPVLMFLGQPLALVIAGAQAVQLPVAAAATLVHAGNGVLDWQLGCTIGIVLLAGSLGGAWIGRRIDTRVLQRVLSALLVAIGAWLVWTIFRAA